jgi:hypothetical protein
MDMVFWLVVAVFLFCRFASWLEKREERRNEVQVDNW